MYRKTKAKHGSEDQKCEVVGAMGININSVIIQLF